MLDSDELKKEQEEATRRISALINVIQHYLADSKSNPWASPDLPEEYRLRKLCFVDDTGIAELIADMLFAREFKTSMAPLDTTNTKNEHNTLYRVQQCLSNASNPANAEKLIDTIIRNYLGGKYNRENNGMDTILNDCYLASADKDRSKNNYVQGLTYSAMLEPGLSEASRPLTDLRLKRLHLRYPPQNSIYGIARALYAEYLALPSDCTTAKNIKRLLDNFFPTGVADTRIALTAHFVEFNGPKTAIMSSADVRTMVAPLLKYAAEREASTVFNLSKLCHFFLTVKIDLDPKGLPAKVAMAGDLAQDFLANVQLGHELNNFLERCVTTYEFLFDTKSELLDHIKTCVASIEIKLGDLGYHSRLNEYANRMKNTM